MEFLTEKLRFPDPESASRQGLLAVGGDLKPERLMLAYNSGIFPWYSEGEPLLWWSPDPRMVLFPENFKVSGSLKKTIDSAVFEISFNTKFSSVIENCARIKRKNQSGTWITPEMKKAYIRLHQLGFAHSVEVWKNNKLAGGLYGIDLPDKKIFCGESMFSHVSDASKVGFYFLNRKLKKQNYRCIDCQIPTPHLKSLGGTVISRTSFLKMLKQKEEKIPQSKK